MTGNAKEPSGFDPISLGATLMRTIRAGTLATLDRRTGAPFASLVSVATDLDGAPLLLLSALAAHTANLDADPRASLLLAQGGKGDPLAHPRLTVTGRVSLAAAPRIRDRFLRRHPKAALYADFPDFSFRRLAPETGHLNGGFARAATLGPDDLVLDLADAADLVEAEDGAVAHLNADHREALSLYATRLLRLPKAPWRATGLDPQGLDLAAGDRTARLAFGERIRTAAALRRELKRLADRARQAATGEHEGPVTAG